MAKRVLIASDIHNCHIQWYGVPNEVRMKRFLEDVRREYEREPFDLVLLLGDYSLDFWAFDEKGCWINRHESRTQEFVNSIRDLMPVPFYMIPGNHEQYDPAQWKLLTGFERQFSVTWNRILFLMLDTYAGNLNPMTHSDGTYTGMDLEYVHRQMKLYPDHKVVLCAHFYDFLNFTDKEKQLLCDPRIICLLAGHVHLSKAVLLPEDCGGKPLLFTGNYSYSGEPDPTESFWGFRDFKQEKNGYSTSYIVPENSCFLQGKSTVIHRHIQDNLLLL